MSDSLTTQIQKRYKKPGEMLRVARFLPGPWALSCESDTVILSIDGERAMLFVYGDKKPVETVNYGGFLIVAPKIEQVLQAAIKLEQEAGEKTLADILTQVKAIDPATLAVAH